MIYKEIQPLGDNFMDKFNEVTERENIFQLDEEDAVDPAKITDLIASLVKAGKSFPDIEKAVVEKFGKDWKKIVTSKPDTKAKEGEKKEVKESDDKAKAKAKEDDSDDKAKAKAKEDDSDDKEDDSDDSDDKAKKGEKKEVKESYTRRARRRLRESRDEDYTPRSIRRRLRESRDEDYTPRRRRRSFSEDYRPSRNRSRLWR